MKQVFSVGARRDATRKIWRLVWPAMLVALTTFTWIFGIICKYVKMLVSLMNYPWNELLDYQQDYLEKGVKASFQDLASLQSPYFVEDIEYLDKDYQQTSYDVKDADDKGSEHSLDESCCSTSASVLDSIPLPPLETVDETASAHQVTDLMHAQSPKKAGKKPKRKRTKRKGKNANTAENGVNAKTVAGPEACKQTSQVNQNVLKIEGQKVKPKSPKHQLVPLQSLPTQSDCFDPRNDFQIKASYPTYKPTPTNSEKLVTKSQLIRNDSSKRQSQLSAAAPPFNHQPVTTPQYNNVRRSSNKPNNLNSYQFYLNDVNKQQFHQNLQCYQSAKNGRTQVSLSKYSQQGAVYCENYAQTPTKDLLMHAYNSGSCEFAKQPTWEWNDYNTNLHRFNSAEFLLSASSDQSFGGSFQRSMSSGYTSQTDALTPAYSTDGILQHCESVEMDELLAHIEVVRMKSSVDPGAIDWYEKNQCLLSSVNVQSLVRKLHNQE
eukprot:TRINITY_DN1407_c1_g1_i1.p1 TRINITY_DN1407_c1_g1~~TRINITY_DN1407_c1_g1_i1.p1  ORF type:complete len:491 (+),score=45.27 TRINITY_DN1407_c1_g1_i1:206-1678(+)